MKAHQFPLQCVCTHAAYQLLQTREGTCRDTLQTREGICRDTLKMKTFWDFSECLLRHSSLVWPPYPVPWARSGPCILVLTMREDLALADPAYFLRLDSFAWMQMLLWRRLPILTFDVTNSYIWQQEASWYRLEGISRTLLQELLQLILSFHM